MYNCNCDKGGEPIPVFVNTDGITGYNGLIAYMPEEWETNLFDMINNEIIKLGGLDQACNAHPYVQMEPDRTGNFVPANGDPVSGYWNILHITKARRGNNEFNDTTSKAQPTQANITREQAQAAMESMLASKQPVQAPVDSYQEYLNSRAKYGTNSAQSAPTTPVYVDAYDAYLNSHGFSNLVEGDSGEPIPTSVTPQSHHMGTVPQYVTNVMPYPYGGCTFYSGQDESSSHKSVLIEDIKPAVCVSSSIIDSAPCESDEGTIGVNASVLVETDSERDADMHSFNHDKIGDMPTIQESLKMAESTLHPNDPALYRPNMMGPRAIAPNPLISGSLNPGVFIPNAQPAAAVPSVVANASKEDAIAAMEAMLGRVSGDPIPQPTKTIAQTAAEMSAAGTMSGFAGGGGGREMFFAPTKLMNEKAIRNQNDPEWRAMMADCEAERARVRAQFSKLGTPDWEPNHLVIKTPEFPDGIDKSHPEFERVRSQTAKEMSMFSQEETSMAHDATSGKAMADSYFADRTKAFQEASTEAEKTAAMEGKFSTPLQMARSANVANIPDQLPNTASMFPWQMGMNGVRSSYSTPYSLHPAADTGFSLPTHWTQVMMDKEWMKPTQYELDNGLVPKVTVIRGVVEEKIVEVVGEKFPRIALVKVKRDENGVEWDEYLGGDPDIIRKKPAKLDYKKAAEMNAQVEAERDTYTLAKEIARYNQVLADTLLWYQKNADYHEFLEVKRETQEQLMEYRNRDSLSSAKSSVVIAGDKTVVGEPRPLTIKQLEELAEKEIVKHETQEDKEQAIIDGYREFNSPLNRQMKAVFNDDTIAGKLRKLQALTNITVIPYGDDRALALLNQRISQMTPFKLSEKENYLTWKSLKRAVCPKEERDSFDEKFDEWWNAPRLKTPEQKRKAWDKYVDRAIQLNNIHFLQLEMSQPSPEQQAKAYEAAVVKSWREFDEGSINPSMSLLDFFNNFSFLKTRMIEIDIKKQSQDMRRLYDPEAYLAEVRRHSAIRNFQDGKGYVPTMDLMNKEEYGKKRQLFIDQIFKKANRGTIT